MFAQRLKVLRKERGLTQIEFAERFNVSKGAVGMWETGKREPDIDTISQLAKFFHVSVDYILGNVNEPFFYLDNERILCEINRYGDAAEKTLVPKGERMSLPPDAIPIDLSSYHRIPILGRISAGLPLYADEHIEGYTLTDLNSGGEYFALRVRGDSMNAIGINEGYLIVVRKQEEVEQGEIAVVMVDDEDATVKRFYSSDTTVTLMPQSTNPEHKPQMYDLSRTSIRVLGKVVKVEFTL